MNADQSKNASKNWKESLREDLLTALIGNSSETDGIPSRIAYAYHYYAPASIYKFFRPTAKTLEAITNSKLWYCAPTGFNDVFDSDLSIDRSSVFTYFLDQFNYTGIQPGSPIWKKVQAEMHNQEKQFRNIMSSIRQTTGIACFTESFDSLLMWSLYAQSHQGICVEYELLEFNNALQFSPVPVIYSSKRNLLDKIEMNRVKECASTFLVKALTTKSEEWSYENEWRIIRDSRACGQAWDNKKHGALLPSIKPNSIIFGCAIDESGDFAKGVHKYCETNRVDLYKMEKDKKEYKLNKQPVMLFNEELGI